ncbi:pentatricopeptide repeat-containing protein At1g06143 [Rosa rugosa]|uniref:pentatricopeptide repeat-containing protein At1g06143 n=1 Tax=Rosa rugosa TaxID=74645 RepID=UPI002B408744|nr:pentatricopeptide repeat-containing protein At1g06143 [Rosa rugosa]XP_062024988.1 pentatricopeptide repeat-containing protein At1g06143 [Rosa rugosa]XP_062024989.1 pentatricopeptide repeat-containing protein At1g06143 [Rosa rugosa]XP_062024990.1 pentatricopeptide repeat-containing protein At1g06143 [Rosa rugosa]
MILNRVRYYSTNCFPTPKPHHLQPPKTLSVSENPPSIVDRIKQCRTQTELEQICASMMKTNTIQDSFFTNQLITACSSLSRLDHAALAFSHIQNPNVFVYNAMIKAFVHCGHPFQGLGCYVNMLRNGVFPTSYTFPSLIKACASVSVMGFGEAVHGCVWKSGFDSHVFVQTALIDLYSKLGRIGEAQKVFDEMPERDGFAWTTMVSSHARVGDMRSARTLFDVMMERCIANSATWNTMIDGYARLGDVESAELLFNQMPTRDLISWTAMINCYSQNRKFGEALAVFNDMRLNGVSPDAVTMSTVISACAHLGALDLGKGIHFYVTQNGFDLDVYIGSALIDMYAKCGTLDRALVVFFNLTDKNLFCWNSVIEGLAAHGYAKKALAMFSKMEREKIKPNGITFISVLSACTHAGLVEEGRRRFLSMTQDYSISPGVEHYGCMVDLLSRAGLLEDALELIRSMKLKPNFVIWGALLGGCKLHRNLEIAKVSVNELMVLEPENSGHYNLIVNMYAEVNRWGEVADVRAIMKQLGVEKTSPGSSWIEIERKIHTFSASDKSHAASGEIYLFLAELYGQLKLDVYLPELGSDL